jgi:predicted  nucleic acid-binding Zn-ribbon protein
MFLESFRHIIEMEALKKQNQENLRRISSENKRISDLVERRKKSENSVENLKKEDQELKLSTTQRVVDDLITRQKKLQSQLSLAVTEKEQQAFEKQIEIVKKEIENEESIYFEKLERSENLTSEIEDLKEFIQGSFETLQTISSEVKNEIEKEEKIIQGRLLRINSLKEQLHPTARSLYDQCENKTKLVPPVSFMIDRKCSECHMMLDYALKSTLEQGTSVECCPHCGRLLVPDSAKNY